MFLNMKLTIPVAFVAVLGWATVSCQLAPVPDPDPPFDVEAQYKIDSQLILTYINKYSIEGVQFTESGLGYKILAEGEGPYPQKNDIVSVHYTVSLLDSSVIATTLEEVAVKYDLYDSLGTYAPVAINLGGSFPFSGYSLQGMREGTQLMKLNDRFLFFLPSKLALGTVEFKDLPPNQVLIWEQKMVNIR